MRSYEDRAMISKQEEGGRRITVRRNTVSRMHSGIGSAGNECDLSFRSSTSNRLSEADWIKEKIAGFLRI